MASGVYNIAKERLAKDTINLTTDTLKVLLLGSGYTFDADHQFVSTTGVGTNEVNPTNYVRKTVTVTITRQDASDRAVVIISQPTWTALGGASNATIASALLIKDTGSDATSPLIANLDLSPSTLTTNGSDFTLTFDQTNGNVRLT
jgi:hypothetical protein